MVTLIEAAKKDLEILTVKSAEKIVGGLSAPSKMPWYGWSTSAEDCPTGSKLRKIKGSTCSTCYALKGNYVFSNVKAAHRRRMAATTHPQFVEAFILLLTERHRRTRRTYMREGQMVQENRFRWYDSGDLHDLAMLVKIVTIAKATPQIQHWLPTREFKIVGTYLKEFGPFPDNLTVRMSTPMIGERPTKASFGLPFSTVDRPDEDIRSCPAQTQGNVCASCYTCWTPENVSYANH